MRIALVAMPWANFDVPSAALGSLAASIRENAPDWKLDCLYEYVNVWASLGDLYETICHDSPLGELIYASILYEEMGPSVRAHFGIGAGSTRADEQERAFDLIHGIASRHIEGLAKQLATKYDVVGFTTSYCQLFASVAVSRRLKELDPEVRIVLGGMGVVGQIGESVLENFPFVDIVLSGEGEKRLLQLLRRIEAGSLASQDRTGLVRDGGDDGSADLQALPVPDFSEYADLATDHRILWHIPIEGSRGCWWDRTKRSNNPSCACHFCSLNTAEYREKSAGQIASEMRIQSENHENLRFRFLDNILRHSGVVDLADAIDKQSKDFRFFHEIRSHIRPRELLALHEAGCDTVQIGLEGLSTSYLKRIGKGTSTIQNLQAMKTCYELGIFSGSNLLIGFPGATQAEVDETAENIRRYAVAYQPATIVEFELYRNSTVFLEPNQFKVSNLRNAGVFRLALPENVFANLELFWLDFDEGDKADWSPVSEAVNQWNDLHQLLTLKDGCEWFLGLKPLTYRDGGTFLEIVDRRHGLDLHTLADPIRDLYLFCSEIRSETAIRKHMGQTCTAEMVHELLTWLLERDLMFSERNQYLSLAVACRPKIAARRIMNG